MSGAVPTTKNEPRKQVKDLISKNRFRYRILDDSVFADELFRLSSDELATMHPADLAERMVTLSLAEQVELIRKMPVQHSAEVLGDMDEEEQHSIAKRLVPKRLTLILEAMPADEAADLLGQFPSKKMENILEQMEAESRQETIELLAHGEDTAGGVMEKDLVYFFPETTVSYAINLIRNKFEPQDFLNYLYITNKRSELIGVVSLKELLLSGPDVPLSDLMNIDIVSVSTDEDQEKVAYLASKYNIQAIPVINRLNQLVGIVSPEDITDIIEEEHKEDLYRMAGVHEDSGIHSNPAKAALLRFPWLVATVGGGLIAAHIIEQNKMIEHIWLLSFSPLILGLAGNVAIQSSTIIIRNISVRQFGQPLGWKPLFKEFNTGIFLAILCGITLGVLVSFLQGSSIRGTTLAVSLMAVITLSIICSIIIPVGFNRLDIDPAIASGPLVTTFIDVCGLLIYFQCSYFIMSWMGGY
ncbi:MAG: magnesium transporter [bacterium]|nr:magnesium transporter [bacterium]